MTKELYLELIDTETMQELVFKKAKQNSPKPIFKFTGDYDKDLDNSFLESNWNSGSGLVIHKWLDYMETFKKESVSFKSYWDNDHYYLNISFKEKGIIQKYKVTRYKHRGCIEKFINVNTGKNITLKEYLTIIKKSKQEL